MNEEFYNPYHFVPVAPRSVEQTTYDLKPTDFERGQVGATTHERYIPGCHSGRLKCRLTVKTPLVVGAQQIKLAGTIGDVEPYMVRERGQVDRRPAIPGSSLRGLISSLAEAASNSALRVLDRRPYSYRKPMARALSAIGMIVRDNSGRLCLKPVTLPTLKLGIDGGGTNPNYYEVPREYHDIFPRPAFKVFQGDQETIRQKRWELTSLDYPLRVSQLGYSYPQSSGSPVRGRIYVQTDSQSRPLHCKPRRSIWNYYAISQYEDPAAEPCDGYLRVLGCWGHGRGIIPDTKAHELWLPRPHDDVQALPLDQHVIDRFHRLADERTEASLKTVSTDPLSLLPFHPLDTVRNEYPGPTDPRFRLKPGDLVYFAVDEESAVTEIALSAIWRGEVTTTGEPDGDPAGAHEFFGAVDHNLAPFSARRRRPDSTGKIRGRITIAERMFGFVEENPPGSAPDEQGLALASRIRFSDALLPDGVSAVAALEAQHVPLRILSSPKPPSPALYFKHQDGSGGWIAKADLSPEKHDPQGRKIYLHHKVQQGTTPWKTDYPHADPDQKNAVRPVRAGQKFDFHVDYDNLTDEELGLLLYALAPSPTFHHKLGMGKPLGLGSVKIEVLKRKLIDRQQRYTLAGLQADRHDEDIESSAQPEPFWALRDRIIADGLVSEEIHAAICLLGDFDGAPPSDQIHTPTLIDQDVETETYLWFVANDMGLKPPHRKMPPQEQALTPLPDLPGELPRLRRP